MRRLEQGAPPDTPSLAAHFLLLSAARRGAIEGERRGVGALLIAPATGRFLPGRAQADLVDAEGREKLEAAFRALPGVDKARGGQTDTPSLS